MEDKYLLCALNKNWHHNSPVFWGKNNCGYYSTLEDCEIYTLEEAKKYADENNIPVKLSDLMKYKKTIFENVNMVLNKAQKEFKNEKDNVEDVKDCTTCGLFDIETFTGVCQKFGILNDVKVDCNFWEQTTTYN